MREVGIYYRTHNTRPTFQQPSFHSTGENKALYIHSRRINAFELLYCCYCSWYSYSNAPREITDLTAAVDSPSMDDHLYDTLRCNWLVFLVELTTLGRIHTLQQPPFHSTGENRRRAELSNKYQNKSPGHATTWYQERRDTPRRGV